MEAVFSGALEASHKLWQMLFSFLIGSKPFLIFLLTSSLIHKLFRTVLFSLPDVRGVLHRSFATNFLFVVVRGYTLSDLNFLNLLRLQCPIVWSLLVNVPRVPERNTYSAVVRGNSPLNVKWVSWLMM